jgi:hypothetical protein
MRRAVVFGLLIAVGGLAWLILDADPEGREQLWNEVTGIFNGGAEERAPNWGDVATKVGEFTGEERALREALNPAITVEPEPVPTPAAP